MTQQRRGTTPTTRWSRKEFFKVESERTYDVQVPRQDRLENDLVVTEVPFVPPHESIEEELAADTLATMCREQELHPNICPASSSTLECTWHCVAAGQYLWGSS